MLKLAPLFAAGLLLLVPSLALAHDVGADMGRAAGRFVAALTAEQKAKVQIPFTDAQRRDWHYIPRARKGLPLKEMTAAQRRLAMTLLRSGLSAQGYEKAEKIISLEDVLRVLEQGGTSTFQRDPELYFLTVFGDPAGREPWGWRFEGHHLSLNFSVVDSHTVAFTPSFFGSNPAVVREGPRTGFSPLGDDEALGRSFVNALTADQRRVAVVAAAVPGDILNVPARSVVVTRPEGIAASALTAAQRQALTRLIRQYLDRHRPELAAEDWARIQAAGLDNLMFVWIGGVTPGEPHYYRVQGPTFVLEYDNTQNGANHAHTVWRDSANDFGEDLLKRHYAEDHQPRSPSR